MSGIAASGPTYSKLRHCEDQPERVGGRYLPVEPLRHLDQWRLLCAPQGNLSVHATRRRAGAGTLSAADRGEGAAGLSVHRFLAVHGHLQGQTASRGFESEHGSVEGLAQRTRSRSGRAGCDVRRMISLSLNGGGQRALQILCVGCHSDDIEIGCGGAILRLREQYPESVFHWVVFSAHGVREQEARQAAALFAGDRLKGPLLKAFPDGFLPYVGA